MDNFAAKKAKLHNLLLTAPSPAVAYSGGIDSTLVLYLAQQLWPEKALGILVKSEAQSEREIQAALALAREHQLKVEVVEIGVLAIPEVARNGKKRCYHCKRAMLRAIKEVAAAKGCEVVYDGSNADDQSQYRPGAQALAAEKVVSPLQLCGFIKTNVRHYAKELGLKNWSKPSVPCLLTRFPYDRAEPISLDQLRQIDQGEASLSQVCQDNFRLRWERPDAVRLEVSPGDMSRIIGAREELLTALRNLGFKQVTLDLAPFKSGSFDR